MMQKSRAEHARRPKTSVTGTLSAVAAGTAFLVGLSLGGATFALWHDSTSAGGGIGSGYESFAAGRGLADSGLVPEASLALPALGAVELTVGAVDAVLLEQDGAIAIPFRTDSLSQGNKGLEYTIDLPEWGDGYFGNSDIRFFGVDSPDQCTAENPTAGASSPLLSTPVRSDYSDTTTPTVEYWCLVADLRPLPLAGTYQNEATVQGVAPDDSIVGDSDTWSAVVVTGLPPAADEADHTITFTHTTFRPGGGTP